MIFSFSPFGSKTTPRSRRSSTHSSSASSFTSRVEYLGLTLLLLSVVHDVSPTEPTMALNKDLSVVWSPSVLHQLASFLALETNAEEQGVDTLTAFLRPFVSSRRRRHLPAGEAAPPSATSAGSGSGSLPASQQQAQQLINSRSTVYLKHVVMGKAAAAADQEEDSPAVTGGGGRMAPLSSSTSSASGNDDGCVAERKGEEGLSSSSSSSSSTSGEERYDSEATNLFRSSHSAAAALSKSTTTTTSSTSTAAAVAPLQLPSPPPRWVSQDVISFTADWFSSSEAPLSSPQPAHPFVSRTAEMVSQRNLFSTVYRLALPQTTTTATTSSSSSSSSTDAVDGMEPRKQTEQSVSTRQGCSSSGSSSTDLADGPSSSSWLCSRCGFFNTEQNGHRGDRRRRRQTPLSCCERCKKATHPSCLAAVSPSPDTTNSNLSKGNCTREVEEQEEKRVELYFGNLPTPDINVASANSSSSSSSAEAFVRTLLETVAEQPIPVLRIRQPPSSVASKKKGTALPPPHLLVTVAASDAPRVMALLHRNVFFLTTDGGSSWEALLVYKEQQKWLELFAAAAATRESRRAAGGALRQHHRTCSGRYALVVEVAKEKPNHAL